MLGIGEVIIYVIVSVGLAAAIVAMQKKQVGPFALQASAQCAGAHSAGTQLAGAHSAGVQFASAQSAGAHSVGAHSAGAHSAGASSPSSQVFCPKCGVKLPGGATFCAQCGYKISQRSQASVKQGNPFNGASVAARVTGVVAIIAMLMPWLEVPAMRTISQYASYLGIGKAGDYAYPMYDMGDVTDVLDLLSSTNAYSGIQTMVLLLWLIAFVLLAAGLISSLVGKKSVRLLGFGALTAALVAVLWGVSIMGLDGEYSRQLVQLVGVRVQFFQVPAAVAVTAAAGLAGFVMSVVGQSKAVLPAKGFAAGSVPVAATSGQSAN